MVIIAIFGKNGARLLFALCVLVFCPLQKMMAAGPIPGTPVHALELDGNGGYVRLPDNAFTNLTEATIEAWVNWGHLKDPQRWFGAGAAYDDLGVGLAGRDGNLDFFLSPKSNVVRIAVGGAVQAHTWYHVAAVTGPKGMGLFLNGALVATNTSKGSFNTVAGIRNFIGGWNSGDPKILPWKLSWAG